MSECRNLNAPTQLVKRYIWTLFNLETHVFFLDMKLIYKYEYNKYLLILYYFAECNLWIYDSFVFNLWFQQKFNRIDREIDTILYYYYAWYFTIYTSFAIFTPHIILLEIYCIVYILKRKKKLIQNMNESSIKSLYQ